MPRIAAANATTAIATVLPFSGLKFLSLWKGEFGVPEGLEALKRPEVGVPVRLVG